MDILRTALGIEQMSIKYYKELEEKVGLESVKGVARFLVEQELRHVEFIENSLANDQYCLPEDEETLEPMDVFLAYKKEIKSPLDISNSVISLYNKGIEMEQKSIELYQALLDTIENAKNRSIVETLIAEEKKHKALLDGLLDLARNVEEWIEDPEFSHIGDQY